MAAPFDRAAITPDELRARIASLSDAEFEHLERQALDAAEARRQSLIEEYSPYPKQVEFHAAGATFLERLLRAGTQLGKTVAGSREAAYHLTGNYPDWWKGRRWNRPVRAWVAGKTAVQVRDTIQKLLMGEREPWGTGAIPKASILGRPTMLHSVAQAIDAVEVRHRSGGVSRFKFMNYKQEPDTWAGETLDFVWFDEEPPPKIYTEGISRTNATRGMVWLTFTPLLGMSKVVKRFLKENGPDRHDTRMTVHDVGHLTAEDIARLERLYPKHEHQARLYGIPAQGTGAILPFANEAITCAPFVPARDWPQLAAIDFGGFDHPTAAVRGALDRENDIVYLTQTYRVREQTTAVHAAALRAWGTWLPWAWPHDGNIKDRGSGEQYAVTYRKAGLSFLPEHAKYPPDPEGHESNSLSASVQDIYDRLIEGRMKVFENLSDWLEEKDAFHAENGTIVKEDDDLLSATRYLLMQLRFAKVRPRPGGLMLPDDSGLGEYDPLGRA